MTLKSSFLKKLAIPTTDLAMQPLPFNFVLDFGSNMRSGMLLTMGVHPAWAEIVECATTNKWKEVLKKAKERGDAIR